MSSQRLKSRCSGPRNAFRSLRSTFKDLLEIGPGGSARAPGGQHVALGGGVLASILLQMRVAGRVLDQFSKADVKDLMSGKVLTSLGTRSTAFDWPFRAWDLAPTVFPTINPGSPLEIRKRRAQKQMRRQLSRISFTSKRT